MKKLYRHIDKLSILLLIVFIGVSCEKSDSIDIQTEGKVELTDQFYDDTDPNRLKDLDNVLLPIEDGADLREKVGEYESIEVVEIAELSALTGLDAVDVAEISGNQIVVAHSKTGEGYSSAIDIFKVSGKKMELESTIYATNKDIESISFDGSDILLGGGLDLDLVPESAESIADFNSPAFIQRVNFSKKGEFEADQPIDIPGNKVVNLMNEAGKSVYGNSAGSSFGEVATTFSFKDEVTIYDAVSEDMHILSSATSKTDKRFVSIITNSSGTEFMLYDGLTAQFIVDLTPLLTNLIGGVVTPINFEARHSADFIGEDVVVISLERNGVLLYDLEDNSSKHLALDILGDDSSLDVVINSVEVFELKGDSYIAASGGASGLHILSYIDEELSPLVRYDLGAVSVNDAKVVASNSEVYIAFARSDGVGFFSIDKKDF